MVPHVKNVLLASADQVAIDAVAAKLMGFDPLSIKFIRLAHDLGLGCGDPRDIEIVGDQSAAAENWHFQGPFKKMTFASRIAAPDLLGSDEDANRMVAEDGAGAVGLRRERAVSRQFLVSGEGAAADARRPRQSVGAPVPQLGDPDADGGGVPAGWVPTPRRSKKRASRPSRNRWASSARACRKPRSSPSPAAGMRQARLMQSMSE
jgi:hypothetical protein